MSARTTFTVLWLIAALLTPARSRAQDPSLTGSYRLVADRSDRVEEAVEEATDGAGFFVRTVGRRLLVGKLAPPEHLQIAVTDTLVTIGPPQDAERVILIGAMPHERFERRSGEKGRPAAVAWWEAAVLRVRFAEDEGVRDYSYSLDPDGRTLRVSVSVDGGKLPRPVELSLTYERDPGVPEDTPRSGSGGEGAVLLRFAALFDAK